MEIPKLIWFSLHDFSINNNLNYKVLIPGTKSGVVGRFTKVTRNGFYVIGILVIIRSKFAAESIPS